MATDDDALLASNFIWKIEMSKKKKQKRWMKT